MQFRIMSQEGLWTSGDRGKITIVGIRNMSIVNIVIDVKKIHKESIVLVKVGKFYYCYGKDAYIISYLTNYKINLIENNIYSCAFSTNAYSKVISLIEEKKINYLILDRRNNYEKTEKRNFKNLNNYAKYYEKAKEAIGSRMRIERIYLYIKNNIKDRDLLTNIEKVIENHRISQRGIN